MKKILVYLVVILGGGLSLATCLYILLSLLIMIIYKIYRKIKYHASIYD